MQHAFLSVGIYEQILFLSGMTMWVLSLSLVFIFFSNSENKINDFGDIGDAVLIQFKAFLVPVFS